MAECRWDPSKHGGKPCPVHGAGGQPGAGGHKIRINSGKYEMKLSDDSDWEEVSPEEYNDLREGGYQDFDETVDDDFGFDEDELDDLNGFEDNFTENDIKQIEKYAERYDVDVDELKQRIWDKFNEKIQDGASVTNAKNDAMEEALEDVVAGSTSPMNEFSGDAEESDKLSLENAIKSADDSVLDEHFGKDTPERKLAGAIKDNPESADEKYEKYKQAGLNTWNQKLQKGDKIVIRDRDGNEIDAYIKGFYYKGELQDEDTYEEGKDNMWHDFRGIGLVDENGRDIGNINANQIIKHVKNGAIDEERYFKSFVKKINEQPLDRMMELEKDLGYAIVNGSISKEKAEELNKLIEERKNKGK